MSFAFPAMPRASLVARGCSDGRNTSHRDADHIAALLSSRANDVPAGTSGTDASHVANRISASTKKD